MFKFGKTPEESVGLDIGTYSIKAASIKKEAGENVLTAYNFKKIPPEAGNSEIEKYIEETLSEIDIHPEMLNLSISGPEVIVRFVNFPQMTREQMESALVFEAEKYIPFNVNEVVLDFAILGKASEPGQMRVLLAAAKRELLDGLLKTVSKLGMSIHILDIDPLAMFNAFIEFNSLPEDKGSAFLDLGHSQTDILISIGKNPYFMRQVQIGGKDVTSSIARALSVSPERAEECKLNTAEEDKEAVARAAGSVLDDLVKEIQLSFGYFENRYNRNVGQIFCSGGLTGMEGLIEHLSKKLGIQAKSWNPAEGLRMSEMLSRQDINSIASQLPVCIGLALRG